MPKLMQLLEGAHTVKQRELMCTVLTRSTYSARPPSQPPRSPNRQNPSPRNAGECAWQSQHTCTHTLAVVARSMRTRIDTRTHALASALVHGAWYAAHTKSCCPRHMHCTALVRSPNGNCDDWLRSEVTQQSWRGRSESSRQKFLEKGGLQAVPLPMPCTRPSPPRPPRSPPPAALPSKSGYLCTKYNMQLG